MAERLVKFDNAKLILIVLVVAGHFIETFIFGFAPGSAFASGTFTFIYSFHMPLFIFISGLFLRDMDEQTSFPVRRVAMLITLGFAMKVVRAIFGYVVTGHTSFDLLSDSATPWFMFTLAACYALAWLLRLQNRAAVLVMALLIGMFVGYDQTIGDFLYLSRTVVFFPFFWAGYCLRPTGVQVFTSKPAVRLTAALIVLIFAAACIFATWQVTPLRFLFAGRLPFAETGIPGCGWYTRAVSYLVQYAMCFGILTLVPSREIPLVTRFGSRSLQIYFWHFIPTSILRLLGLFPWLSQLLPGLTWQVLVVVVAIIVGLLLGWRPLGLPLDLLTRTRKH